MMWKESPLPTQHGRWYATRVFSLEALLRMIEFDGRTISALTFLTGSISDWRIQMQLIQKRAITPLHFSMEVRAQFLDCFRVIEKAAQRLEMAGVGAAANRGFNECLELLSAPIGYDAHRLGRIVAYAEQVVLPFMDELQARVLYSMPPRHASLYVAEFPFGEAVEDAFSSASYDIAEAAKCRALARWTASVMHLMRVLEVGLRSLAEHYGIEPGESWNTTLNQIEAKSRDVRKSVVGADEEKWANEAGVHLRFIKNAWRNHAMHPVEKYDEERAVAIFDNARTFMQHLAQKLSE